MATALHAIPARVRRRFSTGNPAADDLARAKFIAYLLDAQFQFLGFRFGLDALIGLVPILGDTITFLFALYIPYLAHRHAVSRWILVRMIANLLLDWLIGITPLVGDFADVAFKANLRNLKLLEDALRPRHKP